MLQHWPKDKTIYFMLIPYLFGLTFLVIMPAFLSLGLVFLNFDLIGSTSWSGFAHLRALAQDRLVRTAFGNSLFFVFSVTFLRFLL
jgi:multiple sugar transport system permease protein